MNSERDQQLLSRYAEHGSEEAFAELVRRYLDFVYSAAFRMVRNPHLAEEVTQSVFVALSQNARALSQRTVLSGWLHRMARNLAAKTVRSEVRRRAREEKAVVMNELSASDPNPVWERLAPELDAALDALKETDRHVVLLRFFHQRSMGEIGAALGLNEEAAKKRVGRALERLRGVLALRGVSLSVGVLAGALTLHSVQAAPAGLAAAVVGAASAGASSVTGGAISSLFKAILMSRLQTTLVGLLFVAGVTTPLAWDLAAHRAGTGNSRAAQAAVSSTGLASGPSPVGGTAAGVGATNTALARLADWLRQADAKRWPFVATHFDEEELSFLIWSLPAADYPAAWRLWEGMKWEATRQGFGRLLVEYWAELDPQAALAAAQALVHKPYAHWDMRDPAVGVLHTWAETEPAAALAWIHQGVPSESQAAVLARILPGVARSEPQTALAALAELPVSLRNSTTTAVLIQWAQVDPAAVAQYRTNLFSDRQRAYISGSIAEVWARQDPHASLAWVQSLPSSREQDSAYHGLFAALAQTDLTQAAALLAAIGRTNSQVCAPSTKRIAEGLVESEPAAAAQWARQLPNAHLQQEALEVIVDRWSAHDPAAAVGFVLTLPADADRQEYLESIAGHWAASNVKAASLWANGLPAGPEREAVLKGVCVAVAEADPLQAATLAASLPPGAAQSQAAIEVVRYWAKSDPKAAAQWVAAFPEGQTRSQAASTLLHFWGGLEQDPAAAAQWLQGLPTGPSRDAAAQQFVMAVGAKWPALAAPWVAAMADEGERNRQAEVLARKWLALDRAAAQQWLQTTSLPESTKRQLLGQ